jgi:hypothetical protein
MSPSSSAPRGAAPERKPELPPLLASLREEGEKSGLVYDWWDPKFIRKIEDLAKKVPREYEVVQAFRAFALDHARGCTPFFFAERFSKYAKISAVPSPPRASPATEPCGPVMKAEEFRAILAKAAAQGDGADSFAAWLKRRGA